jgi:cytochrome c-type biogenesis protein
MTITFAALGTAASLLGRMMHGAGPWWHLILGALMVLMALQTWGLINVIPQPAAAGKHKRKGYAGAALTGLLGGLFSSPCATPVLIVLLAIAAKEGSLLRGILLLLIYSAGHSALIIITGTSTGFANKVSCSEKYGRFSKAFKIVTGALILLLGFYMLYLGLK